MSIECLEQFTLQFEYFDGVTTIYVDEVLDHVMLASSRKLQRFHENSNAERENDVRSPAPNSYERIPLAG
jgi:hypothetical protein